MNDLPETLVRTTAMGGLFPSASSWVVNPRSFKNVKFMGHIKLIRHNISLVV